MNKKYLPIHLPLSCKAPQSPSAPFAVCILFRHLKMAVIIPAVGTALCCQIAVLLTGMALLVCLLEDGISFFVRAVHFKFLVL